MSTDTNSIYWLPSEIIAILDQIPLLKLEHYTDKRKGKQALENLKRQERRMWLTQ